MFRKFYCKDGRGQAIEWTAKSPVLSCAFFLWVHLKACVSQIKLKNLTDLRLTMLQEVQLIQQDIFINALAELYHHIAHCKL